MLICDFILNINLISNMCLMINTVFSMTNLRKKKNNKTVLIINSPYYKHILFNDKSAKKKNSPSHLLRNFGGSISFRIYKQNCSRISFQVKLYYFFPLGSKTVKEVMQDLLSFLKAGQISVQELIKIYNQETIKIIYLIHFCFSTS